MKTNFVLITILCFLFCNEKEKEKEDKSVRNSLQCILIASEFNKKTRGREDITTSEALVCILSNPLENK